jgi:hypothetical protein
MFLAKRHKAVIILCAGREFVACPHGTWWPTCEGGLIPQEEDYSKRLLV